MNWAAQGEYLSGLGSDLYESPGRFLSLANLARTSYDAIRPLLYGTRDYNRIYYTSKPGRFSGESGYKYAYRYRPRYYSGGRKRFRYKPFQGVKFSRSGRPYPKTTYRFKYQGYY